MIFSLHLQQLDLKSAWVLNSLIYSSSVLFSPPYIVADHYAVLVWTICILFPENFTDISQDVLLDTILNIHATFVLLKLFLSFWYLHFSSKYFIRRWAGDSLQNISEWITIFKKLCICLFTKLMCFDLLFELCCLAVTSHKSHMILYHFPDWMSVTHNQATIVNACITLFNVKYAEYFQVYELNICLLDAW